VHLWWIRLQMDRPTSGAAIITGLIWIICFSHRTRVISRYISDDCWGSWIPVWVSPDLR